MRTLMYHDIATRAQRETVGFQGPLAGRYKLEPAAFEAHLDALAATGLVLTYTTTRVFNLGHGAMGMVMAFVFWQLTVKDHMPRLAAALLILLVIAPLMGVVLERVMMRGLGDAHERLF